MASCITSQWARNAPQVKLTVTESSSTGNSVTLSWKLQYTAAYAYSGTAARAYSVKIDGSTVKSGTYSIGGKTGTYTIASGTKTVSKTTAARSVSFSCSFAFEFTWSGVYKGTHSASGSISIPAKTSYSVKYNANGGSGAPGSQTKWYGTALKLSAAKPTRTGHSFQGWATSASGSVAYAAGASYTANASVTLYAVWKANTYTVSFDANGGSGAPASQTKTYGKTLTLSSTKPTRKDFNFLGWATSKSSQAVAYQAGSSYTANAAATLYAVWALAYQKPRIRNLSVVRCDGTGARSDQGTYATAAFDWACDREVTGIQITWKSAAQQGTASVPASGTSGHAEQLVGEGSLSVDATYAFQVTVSDSGGSTPASATLNGMRFAIDFLAGGAGVAVGKPAEEEMFDVNLPARFRQRFEGTLNMPLNQYFTSGNYCMDLGNSDLVGANSIWMNDTANTEAEGLMFLKNGGVLSDGIENYTYSADDWMCLRAYNDELLFMSHPVWHKGMTFKKLWDGTWSSGSITVSGFTSYHSFMVQLEAIDGGGIGTMVLAFKHPEWEMLRGHGGYRSAAGNFMVYSFAATASGNTLTFVNAGEIFINKNTTIADCRVIGIYGIL